MKKIFLLTIGAIIVIAGIFVLIISNREPSSSPSVQVQHINADAYPLYNALTWSSEQNTTVEEITGYEVVSAPVTDITNIAEISMPFDNYYSDKLLSLGWTVDNSLAAGGPGSSITAYKKAAEYIIVSFKTKFKGTKPNEPVQCPCDITFSVFSGAPK